jgi:hypothetical protein
MPMAFGMRDHLDLDDLVMLEGEAECADESFLRDDGQTDCSVHQRGLYEPGMPREGERVGAYSVRTLQQRCAVGR